jgi:Skp family chaperone for outer membrane proteins
MVMVASPVLAGKIGFVDAERAVVTVGEGAAKVKELEAWAIPERQRIEQLGNRVNELRQQIAAKGRVASEDTIKDLEAQEVQVRREFDDARREYDRILEQKQNEFLGDIAVKVGTVASDYAKANDYDAVFVLNAQPLIYMAETADLTDTVIRLYNERFPVTE